MIDFKNEVLKIKDEMLNDIESLVNIPSVYDETTVKENQPYGEGCRKALDKMLEIGKRDGFEVDDCDGYAGHIDIGEGEESFGILGHLDVVPVNKVGWDTDPFEMVTKDGVIYGRGVTDDKGGLIAGYYAAKIINNLDFPKKMKTRIIFGCDEERGSSCLHYYFTKRPFPAMGFTPDAEFPVVYGEKAPVDFEITGQIEKNGLIAMCAGSRPNIVPETCECVVEGNYKQYQESFHSFLANNNLQGTIEEEGNHTKLTFKGKSAHASTPNEGVNAVIYASKYIATVCDNKLVKFINEYLSDTDGSSLEINHTGSMGPLTLNLGVIKYRKEEVTINLDLRCPHECDFDQMVTNVKEASSKYNMVVKSEVGKALYVDPESELITKLHQAYVDVTNASDKPQAIGGGTYAKTMPNCVAFGPEFVGEDNLIHGNNENLHIDTLLRATEIYCRALYELVKA